MIITIFTLFTIAYSIIVLKLYFSWKEINCEIDELDEEKSIYKLLSVIIPIRNESENIISLLNDLNLQDLPPQKFEVIVVDDDSTDGSLELIRSQKQNFKFNLIIKNLKAEPDFKGSHKKRSIALGIHHSQGDFIVTTDGDCRVHHQWLSSLMHFINYRSLECVTGPVTFNNEDSLFEKMQTLEFAFLIGTGAASLNLGFPNMCNGANLAFSKKSFYDVKGYEGNVHIPSGDDEFLMHKIHEKYPDKVCFLKTKNYTVSTKAKQDIKSLFFQRKRWAGKWKLYKDIKITIFAIFYFFFNAMFLIALIMAITGEFAIWFFLVLVFTRITVDYIFIKSVLKFLKKKFSWWMFLLAEAIYPIYVIILGIAVNFGYYEWKGRKIK
ncbi:glycosyltransferase [soil metagenome]